MTPTTFAFIAMLIAAACVIAIIWRRTLVMSLPLLVALSGATLHSGGFAIRLDQIAASALVIPLVVSALAGTRRLRIDATAKWLGAILAMNLLASLLNSPDPTYSVAQCANLASEWVIYLLLINFLDTDREVESFTRLVLSAAIAVSVIGVGAYVLALSGLDLGGAEVSDSAVEHLTNAYGAYGPMLEPNLFGSFTCAHLVLVIVLLVISAQRPETQRWPRLLVWVAATTAVGLVLSFTRAAWIGAAVGMLWFVFVGARTIAVRVRARRFAMPIGVALVLAAGLLVLPGDAGTLFRFKILNLLNFESQTAVLRALTYTMALEQTVVHPIVGWGTFSFAPLAAQGIDFQQFEGWRNLWIGNFLLLALHDTGAIGVILWCGLVWSILSGAVRTARKLAAIDSIATARTLALTAAVVSLLIPFLTTTGFSLGYPWLLIGLLGAHARLADAWVSGPASRRAPTPFPVLAASQADAI